MNSDPREILAREAFTAVIERSVYGLHYDWGLGYNDLIDWADHPSANPPKYQGAS